MSYYGITILLGMMGECATIDNHPLALSSGPRLETRRTHRLLSVSSRRVVQRVAGSAVAIRDFNYLGGITAQRTGLGGRRDLWAADEMCCRGAHMRLARCLQVLPMLGPGGELFSSAPRPSVPSFPPLSYPSYDTTERWEGFPSG
jgi:hypothetical protein